ncbi:MAG: helix-turn-helix transcriptional regulator [Bacteroidia bacterium]|nr:helix-turn-helix transcriptional regulator [Bacteroidota bacterium]MBP6412100.1 helix-turn-helix transcriptional regulator [Bacteroidia bacterium]
MLSNRSKAEAKEELKKLGLHYVFLELGEIELMEDLTALQRKSLKDALQNIGLELMEDKKAMLVEKIKNTIINMVHYTEETIKINFSNFLSEKLDYDYTYLANLFSELQGGTIEQYIINHKIERVKEYIIYGELNITEIASKMNYSSVAHLSTQFKKVTGLTPSKFKQLKERKRFALEEIGNVKSSTEN